MAKTKITALTELTDTNIAIGDLIPIVDVSDTSQAASGTTKKVTITSLATAVASAFSGDSPTFVNLTTTGTTTLGDSGDATTVNGTLGVTGNATFDTNVLFVDAAQDRVGIGTVTPARFFHIYNPTSAFIQLSESTGQASSNGMYLQQDGTATYLINQETGNLYLGTDNSVDLTILTGGNVGIGQTSPAYKLDVVGTAGLSTGTAWTNTSDKRIKKNITSIVNGLEKINQLNPVEFNYIQEYLDEHKELKDIRYNSFIADEYAEVFPNAVNVGGNLEKIITKAVQEVKNEQGEIITAKIDEVKEIIHEKLLNYTPHDLIMYLVASVKELSAKVTALEAK